MLLLLQWSGVRRGIWVDSDVYAMGGQAILDGRQLYGESSTADLRFTYTPFAATAFVPLALSPVYFARLSLTLVSLASLVAVVRVLSKRLRLKTWVAIWIGVTALALEPVLRTLLLGQINLLLMALVVVDLIVIPAKHRGYLVGVAAGFKLTPGVFVLVFAVQRQWRQAFRALLGFIITVAVGWLASPEDSQTYWSGGLFALDKFGVSSVLGTDNQSLLAATLRLLGTPASGPALQVALFVIGVSAGTAAAYRASIRGDRSSEVETIAYVAFGGLLASPISWSHHWVWVILIIVVITSERRPLALAVVLLIFWFPAIWLTYTTVEFGEVDFSIWRRIASTTYVICAICLLARGSRVGKSQDEIYGQLSGVGR